MRREAVFRLMTPLAAARPMAELASRSAVATQPTARPHPLDGLAPQDPVHGVLSGGSGWRGLCVSGRSACTCAALGWPQNNS